MKQTLSEKKINVPTLNQDKAYYYPEEDVKQFIKELFEEVKEIEWDKKWEKEYKGITKRLFQEHNVSVKRLNKIIKQKTGELE